MFCIQNRSRQEYETPPVKRNSWLDKEDSYRQKLLKNHSQQRCPTYNLKENDHRLHVVNDKLRSDQYSKSCLENYEARDRMKNITNVTNFEATEQKGHSRRLFNICQQHYKENMKTLCEIVKQQSVQTIETENHYKRKYKKAVEKLRACELQNLDLRNENLKLHNLVKDQDKEIRLKKERTDYLLCRSEKLQRNLDELTQLFQETKTQKQQEIDDLLKQNEQYKNDLELQFKELEQQIGDLQSEYDKILKKERGGLNELKVVHSSLKEMLLKIMTTKEISLELLTEHRKKMPQIEWSQSQLSELDKNCQIVLSLVEDGRRTLDHIAEYYVANLTGELNDILL